MPGTRRRGNQPEPSTENTENVTETPEEGTVTTQTEAPAEGTETKQTETKAAEAPQDLTPFKEASEQAVAQADTASGAVPDEALKGPQSAYADLKGAKPKGEAKKWLSDQMADSLNSLNAVRARAFMEVQKSLTAVTKEKAPATPADPTEAYVEQVLSLRLALDSVASSTPEGVKDGWDEQAQITDELRSQFSDYKTWDEKSGDDKGEAPKVPASVVRAYKLAHGRAAGRTKTSTGNRAAFTGERGDIGEHIREVLREAGKFLTVAEMANAKSSQYSDRKPSQGAISARLFPANGKVTVDGVTPDTRDGKRGAVLAA